MKRHPRRIDAHYHVIPEPYVEALAKHGITGSTFVPFPRWTPEMALGHLDKTGAESAITSLSSPGVWFGNQELARRLCRLCNEFQAQMCSDYSGRFGSFAFLPLPDVDGALEELEYALDVLDLDGVVLLSDIEGQYLGHPDYEELFAELNRRDAVVFIHPHDDPGKSRRYPIFSPLLEWPLHTTRTTMDLLFSGRLHRYSDISYILAHGGGTLPFMAHHVAEAKARKEHPGTASGSSTEGRERTGREALNALRCLFYDTASPGASHFAALNTFVGSGRLVFGTDGGWTKPVQTAQTVAELVGYDGFDEDELRKIERNNLLGLFPRFAESPSPSVFGKGRKERTAQ